MRRSGVVMVLGLATAASLWGTPSARVAQAHDHASCPHMAKDAHAAGVDHRHDQTTGMAADTSVHHFDITSRGGVIRLESADAADDAGLAPPRETLEHLSAASAAGHFFMPTVLPVR